MHPSIDDRTPQTVPHVFVPLTKGKVAIIDAEDADRVLAYKWSACAPRNGIFYAQARVDSGPGPRTHAYLHRFIMQPPPRMQVDHVNGNTLDCRRANMRIASASENCRNRGKRSDGTTSAYKGVCLNRSRWLVQINAPGRKRHVGYFDDEIEAALAYDRAAIEAYGEFARLNVPEAH